MEQVTYAYLVHTVSDEKIGKNGWRKPQFNIEFILALYALNFGTHSNTWVNL